MNNNPASLTDPDGLRVGTELRKAGVQYGPPAPPWVAEWMDAEWIAILGKLNGDRFGDGGQSAAMWAEVLEAAAKQQADNTGASIDPPNVNWSFMCNYADWSEYTSAVSNNINDDPDPQSKNNETIVVDNTKEAWNHYIDGNGEPVQIGELTIDALIHSDDFKKRHNRIVTGKTTSLNGSFSVDMTSEIFHIGRTNINYSVSCNGGNCTVKYTLFVNDGFGMLTL